MPKKLQLTPDEQLFISNIPLLVRHRDEILLSAEMAGVIAGVSNGLAYSGAFKPATVGDYLVWWHNAPELSHDRHGQLIWKIAGSQLSGAHACKAVDEAGNSHPAELKDHLLTVVRSFRDARQFQHSGMTLSQLIDKLRNG
ncbi:MAG: hypothetical protein NC453_19330 [Muribaculum sp.]|nr:hypothetical protein [Muribaculum sp.]